MSQEDQAYKCHKLSAQLAANNIQNKQPSGIAFTAAADLQLVKMDSYSTDSTVLITGMTLRIRRSDGEQLTVYIERERAS